MVHSTTIESHGKSQAQRVTMSQVAKLSGVSRATVSSILNGRTDCFASQTTRQRVLRTIEALGYRPNLAARAVTGASSATVGMVNTGIGIEVTGKGCSAFESAARQSGYMTMVSSDIDDPELEDKVILWMRDRCVDGIMIVPTERGPHRELRRLAESGFPVVTFDAADRIDFDIDDVSVDHFAGGRMQALHLLQLGRKRVALANSGTEKFAVVQRRIAGLESALREAGCPRPVRMDLPVAVHSTAHWREEDFSRVRDFLAEHRGRIDAVAAVGDTLGMTVMATALQMGIDVPGELAVIGYDGLEATTNPLLSLTTIVTPHARCGAEAFKLLKERIAHKHDPPPRRKVAHQPTLVVRRSTVADSHPIFPEKRRTP